MFAAFDEAKAPHGTDESKRGSALMIITEEKETEDLSHDHD